MRKLSGRLVLATLFCLTLSVAHVGAQEKAEMVDHPFYMTWAKYKVGTTVTLDEKAKYFDADAKRHPDGVDHKTITYTLKFKDDKKVVVSTTVVEREFLSEIQLAPTQITYRAKISKANVKAALEESNAKVEDGTLVYKEKGGDRTLKVKVVTGSSESDGEKSEFKRYYCSEVPGGLVKEDRKTMRNGKLVHEGTIRLKGFKAAE